MWNGDAVERREERHRVAVGNGRVKLWSGGGARREDCGEGIEW
jgi:hypothetical protein